MKNFIKFLAIGACVVFLLTLLFPLEEKKFDLEITATKTNVIIMQGDKEIQQGKNVLTKGEEYTITATAEEGCTLTDLTVNGQAFESGSTIEATTNIVIVATSAVNTIAPPTGGDVVVEPEEPVALPASYFNFNDGTLMGFSAEGQTAYDNGELTELILPSSYSLGELVTEEVTYAEFFELEIYCMKNGYNFTFVNSAGETVAITSEEEFMNNYETLMTLWEENQLITVTMQVQKFMDGTDVVVTSLGDSCFLSCSSLTSITIPNNVTSLGDYCFNGCRALTSITIPNNVTSLGDSCFSSCSALTSITIPNSVPSLGTNCFNSCTALTSITIPDSVTSLGDECFRDCSALTSITIPDSVTSLGTNCFHNCSELISITIPNSVTSLGDYCFRNCSALTSVNIPNNVTILGHRCFQNCSALITITIPNSVTSLGGSCFYNCSALTSITVQSSNCTLGLNAFVDTNNCPIYVPVEALEAYKVATNWSGYADRLQAIPA